MDDDIVELKAQMTQVLAMTEDTNHIVRGRRRSQRWGRFLQVLWWLLVIAISGAAYYYYLAPYVGKLEGLYSQIEGTTGQVPTWNTNLQQFLDRLAPPGTAAPHTPSV